MKDFLVIQGGDAVVNLAFIVSIDSSDEDCWEVTLASGEVFSFEEEDLVALQKRLPAPLLKALANR